MHCPVCGHDNLIGAEVCDNCGADLAGHDVPQATTTFQVSCETFWLMPASATTSA